MLKLSIKKQDVMIALLAAFLTAFLHTIAFPFAFVGGELLCVPEAGYIFLVPFAVWLTRKRSLRSTIIVSLCTFWISWIVLLFWLHYVTFIGMLALALIMAVFPTLWAIAARLALPDIEKRRLHERLAIVAGLAGLWVLLEWFRTWVFSGFPWLPLAASQWNRPAMLQVLPFTGFLGLSWILAFFNLALVSYARSFMLPKGDLAWWRKLNPELYLALVLLALCLMSVVPMMGGRGQNEVLFRAGTVQPYAAASLKWDPAASEDNLKRLDTLTNYAAAQKAQVIFWPESSTPWPVVDQNQGMRKWIENVSLTVSLPIVMGNMADEVIESKTSDAEALREHFYYNGVFVVNPQTGLQELYYAKRKLVPFGEYNPLAFLTDNFIDLPYNFFTSGKNPTILSVSVPETGTFRFGSMLCYEDIFPSMARSSVREGADFLYVATNNAWYGEEAGAYQHAVHSILRAVENRRPVLRCGNGGWSGLIDEYGIIRHLCTRPDKGVYYEGEDVFDVTRDVSWKNRCTFYTRHGDWFAIFAAALVIQMLLALRYPKLPSDVLGENAHKASGTRSRKGRKSAS